MNCAVEKDSGCTINLPNLIKLVQVFRYSKSCNGAGDNHGDTNGVAVL
jgi:hypothetical protein